MIAATAVTAQNAPDATPSSQRTPAPNVETAAGQQAPPPNPSAQPAPEPSPATRSDRAAATRPSSPDALALRGPDIGFPGVGRVLLVFALCAVLALGATILLRRYLPGAALLKGGAASTDIRVLGRARVETSLRVHVIETSGTRVLIAEGRNGLSAVVLPAGGVEPPPAT